MVSSPTMRLLVTGGAGFIGSNFVRYWVTNHPDDDVLAFDVLTYAGNRPNLADVEDRISSCRAISVTWRPCRPPWADTRSTPSSTSPPSRTTAWPYSTRPASSAPTCWAPRRWLEAARRHGVSRFHHISTCEVYGDLALDSDECSPRNAVPSPYALQRLESRRRPRRTGLRRDLRAARHHHQLLQQLRPLPVPREGHPAVHREGPRRPAAPLYASTQNRREWLHVDDHCRAVELVLNQGEVGETYNVGSGVEASIEEIADVVLDATRPARRRSRRSSRTARATTGATFSTPPRSASSWGGSRPCRSPRGWPTRWRGTRPTAAWWEPLLDRAPVVEAAWSTDPPPDATGRR